MVEEKKYSVSELQQAFRIGSSLWLERYAAYILISLVIGIVIGFFLGVSYAR